MSWIGSNRTGKNRKNGEDGNKEIRNIENCEMSWGKIVKSVHCNVHANVRATTFIISFESNAFNISVLIRCLFYFDVKPLLPTVLTKSTFRGELCLKHTPTHVWVYHLLRSIRFVIPPRKLPQFWLVHDWSREYENLTQKFAIDCNRLNSNRCWLLMRAIINYLRVCGFFADAIATAIPSCH